MPLYQGVIPCLPLSTAPQIWVLFMGSHLWVPSGSSHTGAYPFQSCVWILLINISSENIEQSFQYGAHILHPWEPPVKPLWIPPILSLPFTPLLLRYLGVIPCPWHLTPHPKMGSGLLDSVYSFASLLWTKISAIPMCPKTLLEAMMWLGF